MKSSVFFWLLIPALVLLIIAGFNEGSTSKQHNGMQEFTDANFQSKVVSAEKLTLVDFTAPWCVYCKQTRPLVEEAAKMYAGKVQIGKLEVDDNPDISAYYNITSLPTLLFIKNGKVVDQLIGVYSKSKLMELISAHI